MVECEERFNGKDVKTDTCDDVYEVTKRYLGVSRKGNRWQARIRHPKLKFEIYLGRYGSAEEAALVVKKKKAEYEEMFKGDTNSMNVETCRVDFKGRELPSGVYRTGYRRWTARIHHPKLKREVSLGSYNTIEEATIAAENKRAEFWNMSGWRPKVKPGCTCDGNVLEKINPKAANTPEMSEELTGDPSATAKDAARSFNMANAEISAERKRAEFESSPMDRPDSKANEAPTKLDFEKRKLPYGVCRIGRRWRARIWHPLLKNSVSLGSYNTIEEATIAAENKRAEFWNMYGWKPKVKRDCKYDGKVLEKINPKAVSTPEMSEELTGDPSATAKDAARSFNMVEAELSAKRKRAEFEYSPMDRPDSEANEGPMKLDFEKRKLPSGVCRRGRRWRARIWHPVWKNSVSLGSFDTSEEAAIVVDKKREEFLKMYGWSPNVKPGCKYVDKLEKTNRKVVSTSEILDELTGDLMSPTGVRKLKSGKWCARITDPNSSDIIWLGTFATAKDAVRCFNMAKAELSAKRNRTECDGFECESVSGYKTSVLGSDYLDNTCVDDKSNDEVGVAYVPDKSEFNVVHSPANSIFESENSSIANFCDKFAIIKGNPNDTDCASRFDEAMSLGIINEYGQLMGMYSELDKTMEFIVPDEDVADLGYSGCSF